MLILFLLYLTINYHNSVIKFHKYIFKIQKDRIRQRITRPIQRSTTTTTTTEEPPPSSSATESYSSKVNRRRKFRPEYTTTSTSSYEEGMLLMFIQFYQNAVIINYVKIYLDNFI